MSFLLDSESPYRSNVSGVTALDDSQDMSVVIRVCLSLKKKISRNRTNSILFTTA
jgi:hypothetical protein